MLCNQAVRKEVETQPGRFGMYFCPNPTCGDMVRRSDTTSTQTCKGCSLLICIDCGVAGPRTHNHMARTCTEYKLFLVQEQEKIRRKTEEHKRQQAAAEQQRMDQIEQDKRARDEFNASVDNRFFMLNI